MYELARQAMWAIWWRENPLAPSEIRTWNCPAQITVGLYYCTRTAWQACIIEQYVIIVGRGQKNMGSSSFICLIYDEILTSEIRCPERIT